LPGLMSFRKTNPTSDPDHLLAEAAGLAALQHQLTAINSPVKTPQVLEVTTQQLTLERIQSVAGSRQQWQAFGQALAEFHQVSQDQFGWSQNNYIGLNPQHNGWDTDWGQFFYQQRLMCQINWLSDSELRSACRKQLVSCRQELINCLNQHTTHPALLHGDLWSGNVLFDQHHAWLIDPAVYCGDPEADLAMTELFGGFPGVFYQGYRSVRPVSAQYPLKKVIYNLYHQLNHLNLFGNAYRSSVETSLQIIEHQFNSLT
jgi:fructosamine-3-kinase